MCRHFVGRLLLLACGVALAQLPSLGWAQNNNNNNNNGGGGIVSGVAVNASGVLEMKTFADPTGQVRRQQAFAARQSLSRDVQGFSRIRKISLTRLEQAIRDKQGVVTEEMKALAGLLRVRYVFFYPDSKDIVVAGPAEGWMIDPSGRTVGMTSGRPVVQLQDLVTALRAFPPGKKATQEIGCSIDPTPEGLAAMQQFLRSVPTSFQGGQERAVAAQLTNGLRQSLGLQKINVNGVPGSTHFAQVMVEADYRMKLIGIGLEQPPVRMVSFIDRASPSQVSRNALVRWYFVPDYSCVRVSEDKQAMELVGDGVKLVGEDELVSSTGHRQGSGTTNKASQAFVVSFTKNYSMLADRSPVYAELRNLIDLSVAAAFIQQQDYCRKASWDMELLGDEKAFPVQTYNVPKNVASAVAAVFKGPRLMTPIGGGVQIQPMMAVKPENLLPDENREVANLRSQLKVDLPKGHWWWD